jgi:hypothetical protein
MYSFDWGSVIIARIEGIHLFTASSERKGDRGKDAKPAPEDRKIPESASFLPT